MLSAGAQSVLSYYVALLVLLQKELQSVISLWLIHLETWLSLRINPYLKRNGHRKHGCSQLFPQLDPCDWCSWTRGHGILLTVLHLFCRLFIIIILGILKNLLSLSRVALWPQLYTTRKVGIVFIDRQREQKNITERCNSSHTKRHHVERCGILCGSSMELLLQRNRAPLATNRPEGVEEWRHKLRRREYTSPGPNYWWCVDGYNKQTLWLPNSWGNRCWQQTGNVAYSLSNK